MPLDGRTVRSTNFHAFLALMLTRPAGARRRFVVGSIIEGGHLHRGPVGCCISSSQYPNSRHVGGHHRLGQYAGHAIAFFESADGSKRSGDRFVLEVSRRWHRHQQRHRYQHHYERPRRTTKNIHAALARASGSGQGKLSGSWTRASGRIRKYGAARDAAKGRPL
jgi:hypothetical protein